MRVTQSLELPANPLDQLTELCGGQGVVAEMTGRKGQLVRDENDGLVKYQNRRAEVASQKLAALRSMSHAAPLSHMTPFCSFSPAQ